MSAKSGQYEPAAVRPFQEVSADLLDHAVEVVNPAQPGLLAEPAPELGVIDRPVGQLLPPATVDAGCRWLRSSLCRRASS